MTHNETAKIITVIIATYPGHYNNFTQGKLEALTMAWNMALESYTYNQANDALKKYIKNDTKGFPPSPGQVIAYIPTESEYAKAARMITDYEKYYLERQSGEMLYLR